MSEKQKFLQTMNESFHTDMKEIPNGSLQEIEPDSVHIVDFLFQLEEIFKIRINTNDEKVLEKIQTMEGLYKYVAELHAAENHA